MSLRAFEPLNESRLLEVCAQRTAESQTLDFKQALPGSGDKEKNEFLKDICALANRDGGDLVYGIAEASGVASGLAPVTSEPADAAKRRLGQVVDAGLEPRLIGIEFRDVAVAGGYVLVVRVPASFAGPHRYNIGGVGRFVMRNGTHTTDFTYQQLRAAFDRTATLLERARTFRDDRIRAIHNRWTWKPIYQGPICAVHLIPIAGMGVAQAVDVQALYNKYTMFMFNPWNHEASRFTNLDGLVVHPPVGGQPHIFSYAQIFRSGAMEAVRLARSFADVNTKLISAVLCAKFIREAIGKFTGACRDIGIAGPAIAGASLLSIGQDQFMLPDQTGRKTDRDLMVLPDIWIESLEALYDVDSVARPMLDVLWEAFDSGNCSLYGNNGAWIEPR